MEQKEITVSDLVDASLERIQAVDGKIGAFLNIDEEGAQETAKKLQEKLDKGEKRGLLFGLPAGIKDNIVTEGCCNDLCEPVSGQLSSDL